MNNILLQYKPIMCFIIFLFVLFILNNDNETFTDNYITNPIAKQNIPSLHTMQPIVHPTCDHVPNIKNKYFENYNTSNIGNAFDCYNNCIKNGSCGYVGIGFDCYNNCFDNVDIENNQNNTLGDYNE